MALAAAEPSMAAPLEAALGMIQGRGTQWASSPLPLSLYIAPVHCPSLTEADNADESFLLVCKKKNLFTFVQRTEYF